MNIAELTALIVFWFWVTLQQGISFREKYCCEIYIDWS